KRQLEEPSLSRGEGPFRVRKAANWRDNSTLVRVAEKWKARGGVSCSTRLLLAYSRRSSLARAPREAHLLSAVSRSALLWLPPRKQDGAILLVGQGKAGNRA